MKHFFKIIVLLILPVFSIAQTVNKATIELNNITIAKEHVNIITNTEFVLAGESIYYSFFAFEGDKTSTISKIGYVELVGADKTIILSDKLRLNKGIAQGDFFIPTKIRTGHYKLLGYTNWSKNNTDKHSFAKDVFIVNPFSANSKQPDNNNAVVNITKKEIAEIAPIKNNAITITTSKTNFKTREAVQININSNNNTTITNGNYSLSVRKLDSVHINTSNKDNYITAQLNTTSLHIPELRGELISGKITNIKNNETLEGKSISLSITGKNYIFKIAKTNVNGEFYFNITEDYLEEKAVFQIIDANKTDYKIALTTNTYNNYDALVFNPIKLNPNLKQSIEQRSIQNQIENAYYEKKQDSFASLKSTKPFYYPLGTEYILDDYTRFKTVRESFVEVVLDAAVRVNGDSSRFVVYDYQARESNNTISTLEPLVLVDGMIVENNDDLLYYNCDNIKKITIVKGQYLYGAKLFDGIIDIETFLQDFKSSVKGDFLKEVTLKKPVRIKKYYQPDYTNVKTNRTPDYRRQLLWLPNVTFNTNTLNLTTYTSDNTGTYEVLLQGYDTNGKPIKATNYFTVKK
jgi:hypothetical protein